MLNNYLQAQEQKTSIRVPEKKIQLRGILKEFMRWSISTSWDKFKNLTLVYDNL